MLLTLYRTATYVGGPLIALHLRRRARLAKEEPARLGERFGRPSAARPAGPLVWMHAASVGESLAALPLIDALLTARPALHVLVTTGTVSSAALMAARLPPRTLHQFVPVDRAPAWHRFLGHWRPDLACLIESEIWPNLILETRTANVPVVLVNGRMSPRSFRRWQKAPTCAARLFGQFELCLARSDRDARFFRALGGRDVRVIGDLKHAAMPLPVDQEALARLRRLVGARPVWVAASTHPGEERAMVAVHDAVRRDIPSLLTVIVPRHPERGDALAAELRATGLKVAQRSRQELPDAATVVYLGDTLGELGLFYRLASLAFIGGSLVPHGGQNPLEPARLGCPPLFGPHTANFEEMTGHLEGRGAGCRIRDTDHLAATVLRLLTDRSALAILADHARKASRDQDAVLKRLLSALAPLLDRQLGPGNAVDRADAPA